MRKGSGIMASLAGIMLGQMAGLSPDDTTVIKQMPDHRANTSDYSKSKVWLPPHVKGTAANKRMALKRRNQQAFKRVKRRKR